MTAICRDFLAMQASPNYVSAMLLQDPMENTRKRLLWRAMHRGIKEMDIMVGGYAQRHLRGMKPADLTAFAAILEIPDQDLLRWATGLEPVPPEQHSAMLADILAFRPEALA